MKKVCVFLMFVLFVYGMFPAYATTDIAADAESSECVENITGTYSGDANFKAKWTPNTVQLNWYNNHTLMQNVSNESNTCNYGATLTIPTIPPERTGYIFDGWKVRPTMDFSTLTSLSTGSERWARGYESGIRCWHASGQETHTQVSCKTTAGFNDLELHEWKVEFRSGSIKGTLYGTGYCSAKWGDYNNLEWQAASSADWLATYDELEEDTTNEKMYCWCQTTGWKPDGSSTIYTNSNQIIFGNMSVDSNIAWVFGGSRRSTDFCARVCSVYCAYYAYFRSNFRRALFVGAGN